MTQEQILAKANSGESLTVEEVKIYQELVKPIKHIYGKYGNIAKDFIENHRTAKLWCLAGDLPEYLHNIDKQANEIYDTMYKKLSSNPKYKSTDNFMQNLQNEKEIQRLIHEEILNELVYVD